MGMLSAILSGRIREDTILWFCDVFPSGPWESVCSAGYAFGKSVLKTQQSEMLNYIFLHSRATVSQNEVFIAFMNRVNLI